MSASRRSKTDELLRGLTPPHQRKLSVSSSNALDMFSFIQAVVEERQLVLLLDYDGTLTPIVNDPSKALLSEKVRSILRELPKYFITGVISGRALSKIREFVGVPGLFYAGSHGFDILAPSHPSSALWPDHGETPRHDHTSYGSGLNRDVIQSSAASNDAGSTEKDFFGGGGSGGHVSRSSPLGDVLQEVRHQVAGEYLPVMALIKTQLEGKLRDVEGSEVEDNRFSISIHYRNCARSDVPRVKDIVMGVQSQHERIRMGGGKEVFELQPDISWDKGKAVLWLLNKLVPPMMTSPASTAAGSVVISPHGKGCSTDAKADNGKGFSGADSQRTNDGEGEGHDSKEQDSESRNLFTIFIGDDKTDENAFQVFGEDYPSRGGHDGMGILVSEQSRETNAAYTLRNPHEVELFLGRLLQLARVRAQSDVAHCDGLNNL